eukprot:892637-Amphidinium_carterae.1
MHVAMMHGGVQDGFPNPNTLVDFSSIMDVYNKYMDAMLMRSCRVESGHGVDAGQGMQNPKPEGPRNIVSFNEGLQRASSLEEL